ncbi:uncharacterized protein Z519_03160 [Cladophialophora bantiana CBS 173.52]|uniref:Uncharacterized protein n=1 Tax=Cladophialophora bantiana (strain ATCC 10958 / CBS 173.52 / CDC B-1940 / NIH 8579) TaxID=1442370 RepID=A0A0D2HRJ0_CLAB1|nr:uncharacterized protein Z519_03160 [Cladophialophora bantiana CBS 173.52]KIW96093.1 hypothetical protein Z519_03160 [Cladophialophora bantiana CBS 173.52]
MATDPTDPPALRFLDTLLPCTFLLSTFGSLITFTTTVGIFGGPRRYFGEIQVFIALAWLFFLLSLAMATVTSMALAFHRQHVRDAFERGYKSWRGGAGNRTAGERSVVFGIVVLGLGGMWLMLLECLAFVFLSLSVAAYCLAVGWIGFVVSAGMMILTVVFWVLMGQRD